MKRFLSALLAVLLLLPATLSAAAAFSDVAYDHWASDYINRASSQGWVKGMGGDYYGPELPATAAEFFSMIANAFFPGDLPAQAEGEVWYAPVWSMAQTLKLQDGTSVQAAEQLTAPLARQDMARIICNVLSAKGFPLPQDSGSTFADWEDISPSCRSAVSVCAAFGILNGTGQNQFSPLASMTRAEAAVVLCRIADALSAIEVIRLVNAERAREGLNPVAPDPVLMEAAHIRAVEIKESFSHTRPNGQSCMTVLDDLGVDPYSYTRSGENIAAGYGTPEDVMEGWMNSAGHRMNILTDAYTLIGVGRVGNSWVQIFGGK